jgi:hypothetical protein
MTSDPRLISFQRSYARDRNRNVTSLALGGTTTLSKV